MTIQELYEEVERLPQRKTFMCTETGTELSKYANQPFSVVTYFLEPDDQHDVECLPMLVIAFNDGTLGEAFFDECFEDSSEAEVFYQNLEEYLALHYP